MHTASAQTPETIELTLPSVPSVEDSDATGSVHSAASARSEFWDAKAHMSSKDRSIMLGVVDDAAKTTERGTHVISKTQTARDENRCHGVRRARGSRCGSMGK